MRSQLSSKVPSKVEELKDENPEVAKIGYIVSNILSSITYPSSNISSSYLSPFFESRDDIDDLKDMSALNDLIDSNSKALDFGVPQAVSQKSSASAVVSPQLTPPANHAISLPVLPLLRNPGQAAISSLTQNGKDGVGGSLIGNAEPASSGRSLADAEPENSGTRDDRGDGVGMGEAIVGSLPAVGEFGDSSLVATSNCENSHSYDYFRSFPNPIDMGLSALSVRNFSQLNLADWEELNRHLSLLGGVQNRHLRLVGQKLRRFPKRYNHAGFLSRSAILLLSEGWASAERYAYCGIANDFNKSGACKLHKFCPYCSWTVGRNAQLTYVPSFEGHNWYFLTGSFSGQLTLGTDSVSDDAYSWLDYWDSYVRAFEKWVGESALRGIYWVEELAVNSLLPTKVLPHVHAIVQADSFDKEDIEQLNEAVIEHLESTIGCNYLEPNIRVSPIRTARSLMDHLRYMHKPIHVEKAYEMAWPRASFHNRYLAQPLNSQVADLVLGYTLVTTKRRRIQYKGNLNPKKRCFIGVRRKNQRKYAAMLARIRATAHDEYIEVQPEQEEIEEFGCDDPQNAFDPSPVLAHPPHQKVAPSATQAPNCGTAITLNQ